ncbi:MAG: tetratricopeptide repeat protein [Syntrophothermus sp.]
MADSLIQKLDMLQGEQKVDAIGRIADILFYINNKKSIEYSWQGVKLAKDINYQKGVAACYGSLGLSHISLDMKKAIEYTNLALDIRRKINDRPGMSNSLNVLGLINYYSANYAAAIDYHLQSLKIREELKDDNKILGSYNNIGLVYMTMGNYELALDYLNKSLVILKKLNKSTGIAFDNIGNVYIKMGQYKRAIEYHTKGLAINKKLGYRKAEAYSLYNLGLAYSKLNDTSSALQNFRASLKIYDSIDEHNGIAEVENGIASVYHSINAVEQAIDHALLAMEHARPINSAVNITASSDILYKSYEKQGNYKKAFEYLRIYQSATDSANNIERIRRLGKVEFDYRIERFRKEQEAELSRQKNFIIMLIVILVFLIAIALIVIWGYNNKKRLSVRLRSLNDKLQQTNRSKDRFLSIIAHDLRGPFQGLLGISEVLSEDLDELEKKEIKDIAININSALKKQYELLNDLLDWSRLQSGNFELKPEEIPLNKAVSETLAPLSLMADQKSINLINEAAEDLIVSADRNMLHLVLRNLVTNSIKFTGQNGFVKISAQRKEKFAEIVVADNGIGISDADREKLFRLDVLHTTKGTSNEMGSGLGLILCKEIVEKHGGTISAESCLNEGSRFIFTMPLNRN